ncbi:hypothetical protein E3N84_05195 [Terrimesophilobacter mesophilus]|uniref:Signal transduction histidine kinase n=1 Tax=Terrimesophilobacter mesophilus TaxID=433647 RepID=A0A4R8VFY8_9MICO|nr:hypothetical protein E3N84_05195 [Terrimesophilobacter mesophilus]
MISIPRFIIVALAAVFSGYHLLLAVYSINVPRDKVPFIAAMIMYAIATAISLWPSKDIRMPLWMAIMNVAVCIALPILVTAQLDVHGSVGSDYSTWYPAAIGTLMVITSTRKQHFLAWVGVLSLAVQTTIWAGVGALATLGVVGSIVWVAVSHVLSRSLAKIGKDAQQYVVAEREAADWQAAQEAHLFERQFRLRQTNRMALPMLRQIVARKGDLTDAQRSECVYLEAAIRDEIRGRKLLNNRVRDQVMRARRRGAIVTLLDEGGIDELSDAELERVLNSLADALKSSNTDRLIARTVPEGSDVAVTVVGLNSSDGGNASALGHAEEDDEDDQVDLWLEIPRALER